MTISISSTREWLRAHRSVLIAVAVSFVLGAILW